MHSENLSKLRLILHHLNLYLRSNKKKAIFTGSGILLLIILSVLFFIRIRHTPDQKEHNIAKQRLSAIFSELDTAFWKNKDSTLLLSREAYQIATGIGDSNSMAEALYNEAGALRETPLDDSSLVLYNRALGMANAVHNDSLKARIKNCIGNYYFFKDNYYLATRYFTEAREIADSLKDNTAIGVYSNGLGLVNLALGNLDTAVTYFKRTAVVCEKTGNLSDMSGALMNTGNCYIEKKDFPEASAFLKKALVIAEKVQDHELIAKVYLSLGMIRLYSNEGKNGKPAASDYFFKALTASKEAGNIKITGLAYQDLGSYYIENNQLDKARSYFNESLSIFSTTGAKSYEMRANLALSEVNKRQGNWQEAYRYYIRFVGLNDSIQNRSIQKKVSDYQYEIESQKKEYEKQRLQDKISGQRKGNLFLTGGVIFLIILAVVIRSNLKKSIMLQKQENAHLQERVEMADRIKKLELTRHQVEMDAKNKEMVSFSLQLTSKNDLLNQISKLSEKYYNAENLDKAYYNELTKVIESNLDADIAWGQFKELFENVHLGFFNRLRQSWPVLTENDLRFCAYIRINLRPKEIAKILNIGADSVKTYRNRLKKKFGLDINDSLDDFIRNI